MAWYGGTQEHSLLVAFVSAIGPQSARPHRSLLSRPRRTPQHLSSVQHIEPQRRLAQGGLIRTDWSCRLRAAQQLDWRLGQPQPGCDYLRFSCRDIGLRSGEHGNRELGLYLV
jgi:hypothetical protein